MNKPTLQAIAIQKSLELSEREAQKVLVFIAGMEAGRELELTERAIKNQHNPTKQLT